MLLLFFLTSHSLLLFSYFVDHQFLEPGVLLVGFHLILTNEIDIAVQLLDALGDDLVEVTMSLLVFLGLHLPLLLEGLQLFLERGYLHIL